MATNLSKPECVTEAHLDYLDALRLSGVTNMYGAGAYVEEEFDVDAKTARTILTYWMQTFGDRKTETDTIAKEMAREILEDPAFRQEMQALTAPKAKDTMTPEERFAAHEQWLRDQKKAMAEIREMLARLSERIARLLDREDPEGGS